MDTKAQLGVTRVQGFFQGLGWLFREQTKDDFGFDAHVEIADETEPTNRLLGVQVKTGSSFFDHPKPDGSGWTVYPKRRHLDYWLCGSLPMVFVVHDHDANVSYWQVVNDQTAEKTPTGWKIFVPRWQVLDGTVRERFERLARGPTWEQRFRQLLLARKWMKYLAGGDVLVAEFEERIDTTVPRGSMKILRQRYGDDDDAFTVVSEYPYYIRGKSTHRLILAEMFHWADSYVDWAYYQDELQDRCDTEFGTFEGGSLVANAFTVDNLLRMYGNPEHPADILFDGQREGRYRYFLKLNPVGKAFLIANEFLHDKDEMEDRGMELHEEDDDEKDEILDDDLQRARTIIRAWRFGWELVDKATRCTVHNSINDPKEECGKSIWIGEGFRRWEPHERRLVNWCWDCMPDLWVK